MILADKLMFENPVIKFCKTKPNAKLPVKAYKGDAGFDLFFANDKIGEWSTIEPGQSKLFDTGLKFNFSSDYFVRVCNRSGVAAKKHLLVGAEIVDSSYTGSVFVNLHNVGENEQVIFDGDKIAQFVILPNYQFETEEVDATEYMELTHNSERGNGALGSSDKK